MGSSEQNKAVVRACFEAGTRGNLDALDAIINPDYVLHDPSAPGVVRGVDGLRELVEGYRSAIGGLRVTIEQQLTDGDYVATRYTVRGTHSGELMGLAPTGRDVEFSGITISRCHDGQIAEEWEISDVLGLLRQVGALPEMVER